MGKKFGKNINIATGKAGVRSSEGEFEEVSFQGFVEF
jgi:hypothetical protein